MNNSPHDLSLVGTTLYDRYKIIKELGKGGFGRTFLAEDIQMPIQEFCVVKQLNPPSFEPQMVEKCEDLFKKEAVALGQIGRGNPFIPELRAYFTYQQRFYLVQEYIEGKSLKDVMLHATENDAIQIIEDVGKALAEVHKNYRIHRDIKPDNLILRDADRKIVLIDFGAVKEITTQIVNDRGEIVKTVAIGTNGYMAPEQAHGQPCFASDIYSLGIVAIEKLIRKKPLTFRFDEHRNVSWITDLPAGVSLSDGLVKIINKMTRFSLSERYSNIQDVLTDLQCITNLQSLTQTDRTNIISDVAENRSSTIVIENSSSNFTEQNQTRNLNIKDQSQQTIITTKPSSPFNNKKLLIALPIILLLGLGYLVYKPENTTTISDDPTELKISEWKTYEDTNNNFTFSYPEDWQLNNDPVAGDVNVSYSQNDRLYDLVVSVDSLQENISLDRYAEILASDISDRQSVSSPITSSEQQISNTQGRKIVYSTKDGDVEKQVETNFTVFDGKAYIIKITTANFDRQQKREITNRILDSFTFTGDDDFSRGNNHFDLQQYRQAIDDYNRAIEQNPDYALAYYNRGLAYYYLQEYQNAIDDYDLAIEQDPNYIDAYNNRGLAYNNLQKHQQAIDNYNRVIALEPDYTRAYYNRGNTYYDLKQYQQAIDDYSRAIALNPDYALAYYNRGLTYYNLQEYQNAIDDYDKAIDLKPDYVDAYNNRGLAYYYLQEYQLAIDDYNRAIAIDPNYTRAYNNRDEAYNYLNNTEDNIQEPPLSPQ